MHKLAVGVLTTGLSLRIPLVRIHQCLVRSLTVHPRTLVLFDLHHHQPI